VWNETFRLAIHHSEAQAATLNLIVEVLRANSRRRDAINPDLGRRGAACQ